MEFLRNNPDSMVPPIAPPPQCEEAGCSRRSQTKVGPENLCYLCADRRAKLASGAQAALPSTVALPAAAASVPCATCSNRRVVLSSNSLGRVDAVSCSACGVVCGRCQDRGYYPGERNGYSYQFPCTCDRSVGERRAQLIRAAQIPSVHLPWLFGKLPSPERLTPSQVRVHKVSHRWATGFPHAEPHSLYAHGEPGNGKTLAFCRALVCLALREIPSRYVHFPLYVEQRREAIKARDADGEVPPLTDFTRIPVLFLDEILLQGDRALSNFEAQLFALLLHERWQSGRPTLFASNHSIDRFAKELSAASYSRMLAHLTVLPVEGPDFRRKGGA